MLQSLHLDGSERPVAVLVEGPGLRLRRQGVADVFAPLPRLGRVAVHGARVQWRTEALAACLESGVPVLFHTPRGEWLGTLLPARVPAQRRDLAGLLDMAAAVPGFRHRLSDFLRAEEARAALAALRQLGSRQAPPQPHPSVLRRAILAACPDPTKAEAVWRYLAGLATGLVAAELARRGVGPRFLCRRTGGVPLAEEMGRILAWCFGPRVPGLARLVVFGADGAPDPRSRRLLLHAFERQGLEAGCAQVLSRLAGLLADDV